MPHGCEAKVQIIGLQRSGTTWTECLMDNNYWVTVQNSGKHNLPGERNNLGEKLRKTQVPVLLIYKRFDKWLNSIQKCPTTVPKMRPGIYHCGALKADKARVMHDDFYDQWLKSGCNIFWLDYIEMLRDTVGKLETIAAHFGFKRQDRAWDLGGPQNYNGKGGEWTPARRAFYLDGDSTVTT